MSCSGVGVEAGHTAGDVRRKGADVGGAAECSGGGQVGGAAGCGGGGGGGGGCGGGGGECFVSFG